MPASPQWLTIEQLAEQVQALGKQNQALVAKVAALELVNALRERTWTVEEAAEWMSVPPATIEAWIKLKAIRCFRTGDVIRIHPQDMRNFYDGLAIEPLQCTRLPKAKILKPDFSLSAEAPAEKQARDEVSRPLTGDLGAAR